MELSGNIPCGKIPGLTYPMPNYMRHRERHDKVFLPLSPLSAMFLCHDRQFGAMSCKTTKLYTTSPKVILRSPSLLWSAHEVRRALPQN